jgi:hypothetical protein
MPENMIQNIFFFCFHNNIYKEWDFWKKKKLTGNNNNNKQCTYIYFLKTLTMINDDNDNDYKIRRRMVCLGIRISRTLKKFWSFFFLSIHWECSIDDNGTHTKKRTSNNSRVYCWRHQSENKKYNSLQLKFVCMAPVRLRNDKWTKRCN